MNEKAQSTATDLKRLLEGFFLQNKRYSNLSEKVSELGHSLKNTRVPDSISKESDVDNQQGLVSELQKALNHYSNINDQMDSTLEKLSSLI